MRTILVQSLVVTYLLLLEWVLYYWQAGVSSSFQKDKVMCVTVSGVKPEISFIYHLSFNLVEV